MRLLKLSAPEQPERARPLSTSIARALVLLLATTVVVSAGLFALRRSREEAGPAVRVERVTAPADPRTLEEAIADLRKDVRRLNASNERLRGRIRALNPRGLYLIIDTGANRFYMMQDDTILRDAVCSTGSGIRLSDPERPRSWVFDTPRGEFSVLRKVNEPIWTKPDWAFIEVGEDLPKQFNERIEEGVLGDYALDLGDGYLIHGTLFERALGLHVTHGCVRLGAKDLEAIYKSVRPGTKVYII